MNGGLPSSWLTSRRLGSNSRNSFRGCLKLPSTPSTQLWVLWVQRGRQPGQGPGLGEAGWPVEAAPLVSQVLLGLTTEIPIVVFMARQQPSATESKLSLQELGDLPKVTVNSCQGPGSNLAPPPPRRLFPGKVLDWRGHLGA